MKKQIGLSVIVGLLAFCSNSPAQTPFYPGSAESVGLTRIVPDTLVWFDTTKMYPQIGGYTSNKVDITPGSSVEPNARVLGDSTFLLAAGTCATNDATFMSFTSVLIPAAGGTPKLDNLFHDDSGNIWLKQINQSRQTGNPGRMGGDRRYGAINYMTAAEVSLWAYPEFDSDGRYDLTNAFWTTLSAVNGRSFAAQLYQLDPLTLTPTPLMKAQDVCFGRCCLSASYPNSGKADVGRDGSSPVGLANGNFLIVGEDNSGIYTSSATTPAATAVIFAPDGTIVKERWKVSDGQMWDAVTAWRGGFCILPAGGKIYFYDNDGNIQATNTVNASTGLPYSTGRFNRGGMVADIRNNYVFLAGYCPDGSPTNVMLSAFDANTHSWITNTVVYEDDPGSHGGSVNDWVNVACDAYNRVCVTYTLKPDSSFGQWQVAARIFAFDGTKFTALTPSFFPFIQHDSDPDPANRMGFQSKECSVAMTPREILFYAEGLWNGIPNATNPPTTATETHCYTILRHPAPIAKPQPHLTLAYGSPNSTISWEADAGLFVLQSTATPEVPASWADVSPQPAITRTAYVDPTDKYQMSVPNGTGPKFYRLIRRW